MKTIRVDDYMSVAALMTGGVCPLGSRLEGNRVVFEFANEDNQASDLLRKHICGEFHPCSRDLCSQIQQIKSQIFELRRGGASR